MTVDIISNLDYLHELESCYPNCSYSQVHKNLAIKQGKLHNFVEDENSKFIGHHDVDDLVSETKVKYGLFTKGSNDSNFFLGANSRNLIEIPPLPTPNKFVSGYSFIYLGLIQTWDEETRERVLVDKKTFSEVGHFSLLAQIKYLISHNKWRNVIEWTKKLSFAGSLDEFGKFTPAPDNFQLQDILKEVPNILKLSTVNPFPDQLDPLIIFFFF